MARRGEGGQATVELVLVLPVVVLALLLVIQMGLIARAQVLVVHAAREGARAAAVDGPDAARAAVEASPGLADGRIKVVSATDTSRSVDLVRVEVRYRVPTDVPLVGPLVGDPTLTAVVAMRAEGPDG
jgi:hypothetical protein